MHADRLRHHARAIWDAAVAAVRPDELVRNAVTRPGPLVDALAAARHVLVVGGGKAGAAMAAGLEQGLADRLDRVSGIVNVPAGVERTLRRIHTIPVRPAGSNEPTAAAVARTSEMLKLVSSASGDDVVICLLSGGGSALLPAPAEGITLQDKQSVTRLLHASGADIGEMNAVRKHLSRIKGGGLAAASNAGKLFSLIISDVIGDPLDVIASGPTAPDPTTFAVALAILRRFDLLDRVPASVRSRLERGERGELSETLKQLPAHVQNFVLGNNALALSAAQVTAESLGYRVHNLGPAVAGETATVAAEVGEFVRTLTTPVCVLVGGETTVTLPPHHGKGGRNMEFVLAMAVNLLRSGSRDSVVLSGGTDGEDGPTDAAGAIADAGTLERAAALGLDPADFLRRHDSYNFFAATGDLLITGLTETNVMDVRVILVNSEPEA
jgi:hydroxypyruvate reductase/glycerate 2-kinase